ncbi:IS630 family transposase [Rhodopila sp.]|uniref:IS630 family transposase n=1 Tax=Rhodopila sp. TaxID=2480087 RepID=UPI003D0D6DAF
MTIQITRREHDAGALRWQAGRTTEAPVARRLLALALVLEGHNRTDAANTCGMDRQTLRDWVIRYNEHGIAGLSDRPHGGGAAAKLSVEETAQLAIWVGKKPTVAEDGVVRWRLCDLRERILARFFVLMDERSVGRILSALGFSHISVRPRHPKADAEAQQAHKKNFAELVAAAIPPAAHGKPIELWWQDEARVGQQGSLTRIWAERGSRPTAPRDQRYHWAYLFGAVCPARGVGAGLVLPHANVHAMNLHLQEISTQVAEGAFAVLTLDGAGWHQTGDRLEVPENIGLLHLPPYSPELNPVENVWEFLRQNDLSNRVYATSEAIIDACCVAWNKLIAAPERIRSIATRDWAKTVTS